MKMIMNIKEAVEIVEELAKAAALPTYQIDQSAPSSKDAMYLERQRQLKAISVLHDFWDGYFGLGPCHHWTQSESDAGILFWQCPKCGAHRSEDHIIEGEEGDE